MEEDQKKRDAENAEMLRSMGEKLQKFQVATAKRFQKMSKESSSSSESDHVGPPPLTPQHDPSYGDARSSGSIPRDQNAAVTTVAETTLISAAARGSYKLEVASILGFVVGSIVRIGSEIYEERMIMGFGSLELDRPIMLDHPAGTPVVQMTHERPRAARQAEQFAIHSDNEGDDDSTI